jgi:hypothetical protein
MSGRPHFERAGVGAPSRAVDSEASCRVGCRLGKGRGALNPNVGPDDGPSRGITDGARESKAGVAALDIGKRRNKQDEVPAHPKPLSHSCRLVAAGGVLNGETERRWIAFESLLGESLHDRLQRW